MGLELRFAFCIFFPNGSLSRSEVPVAGSMQLVCLGRKDRQVKVRGHRLELLEIEAVMKQEATKLNGGAVVSCEVVCFVPFVPRALNKQLQFQVERNIKKLGTELGISGSWRLAQTQVFVWNAWDVLSS